MTAKEDAKNLRLYFILTYLMFWLLLGFTGFLISLNVPAILQTIMKNVSAWTPTFILIIMYRKLYPGVSFKEYMKIHLMKKTSPLLFIKSFILQVIVFAVPVISFFIINNKPLNTIEFIRVSDILPAFIVVLTSGVLGEELGWRGYALNVLQKKHSPLHSGLIVGIVWGLWHLPLIILSGYTGLDLMYYAIAFMTAIVSTSVIITFFYNKSKNIFTAIWIHFWFNFLLQLFVMEILPMLMSVAAGYFIAAILVSIIKRKELLIKPVPAAVRSETRSE